MPWSSEDHQKPRNQSIVEGLKNDFLSRVWTFALTLRFDIISEQVSQHNKWRNLQLIRFHWKFFRPDIKDINVGQIWEISNLSKETFRKKDRAECFTDFLMWSLFTNFWSDIFPRVFVVLAPQRCSRLFKCVAKVKVNYPFNVSTKC